MTWIYDGPPPREHAKKICAMKTLADRRAYLEREVPERLRDWVKIYVRIAWGMRRRSDEGSAE